MSTSDPGIIRVTERLVYQNRFVLVYDDEVRFPSGKPGTYVRIESAVEGSGVVLVVRDEARIALVRTYRYPLGAWQWALPRGSSQGPSLEETARAEAREELGVTLGELTILGQMTPDTGVQGARVSIVSAEVVDKGVCPIDEDEVAEVRWIPFDQLLADIAAGAIEDGFTLSAVALLLARNGAPGTSETKTPA